jgi:hypothetical protein
MLPIGADAFSKATTRAYYFGTLLPFALNFSPKDLSLPPPAGFVWHCPHGNPVCAANSGFAFAGVVPKTAAVALTNSAVATPAAKQRPVDRNDL